MAEDFSILDFSSGSSAPEPELPEPDQPADSPAEPSTTEGEEPAGGQESEELSREEALIQRLEQLTGDNLDLHRQVPAAGEPSGDVPPPAEVPNFLADLDIDDVLSNSENLNQLLLAVYNKGLDEARKRVAADIMSSLDTHISGAVRHHLNMSELVKDFYDANPDLKSVRRTVAAVANEISRTNPNMATQEVFAKTAEQTRKVLRMPAPSSKVASVRSVAPRRGRVQPEPELVGIEKEIADLLSL